MKLLGIDKKDDGGPFVALRQNRGRLIKRGKIYGLEVVAKGRADWSGWVEMKNELVNEASTRNTAQVVRDVNADVLGVIECEGRAALVQLSEKLLPSVGGKPYGEAMLIDGNDTRGIDVGLMAKSGYKIGWMRSHVDDSAPNGGHVFSRDCPEFAIWTPSGATVWVLVNHFKSKGYGTQEASDARRWLQAETVRTIYERLKKEGAEHIAIIGDLNDTPDSEALSPLLRDTDLKDASDASDVSERRPARHVQGRAFARQDRLCPAVAVAVQAHEPGRHLADGRVGRQERQALAGLSGDHRQLACFVGPCMLVVRLGSLSVEADWRARRRSGGDGLSRPTGVRCFVPRSGRRAARGPIAMRHRHICRR